MNPLRKRRMMVILISIVVIALVCTLILYALRQNINLFYAPNQLHTNKIKPNQVIRVGGMVVKGSFVRLQNNLEVRFKLTDFKATIDVDYHGILPDLFREGQGLVVIGHLIDPTHFKASEVLAKHDEKYMPPGIMEKQT